MPFRDIAPPPKRIDPFAPVQLSDHLSSEDWMKKTRDDARVANAKESMPDLKKKDGPLPDIDWGGITNVNSPSKVDTPFSLDSYFEFDPLPSTGIELKSPQQLNLENRNYLPDLKFEGYVTESNQSEGPDYDLLRDLDWEKDRLERRRVTEHGGRGPYPFTNTTEGQERHDRDIERINRKIADQVNLHKQFNVVADRYTNAPANLANSLQPDVLGGNESAPVWSTTLGEQVAPYYQNVPGGFDAVVDSAIEAQENRGNRPGHYELMMAGYPRWNREDLDARIPVMGAAMPDAHGRYSPYPVYPSNAFGRWDDTLMDALVPKSKYPSNPGQIFLAPPWTDDKDHWTDENDLMNALLTGERGRLYGMPNPYLADQYDDHPMGIMAPVNWPDLKATLDHELTHAAIGGQGMSGEMSPLTVGGALYTAPVLKYDDYPFLKEKPGPLYLGGGKGVFDYYTMPAEMDPRIAEIKRAYAARTGKNITTRKEAEQAWEWYKKQRRDGWIGGGWPTGLNNAPAPFNDDAWFLEGVLEENPVIMEQIYNRLLEIVGTPTTQPGVYV